MVVSGRLESFFNSLASAQRPFPTYWGKNAPFLGGYSRSLSPSGSDGAATLARDWKMMQVRPMRLLPWHSACPLAR